MGDLNVATETVVFPTGGLSATRKASFRSLDATVSTVCGVCARSYLPSFGNVPCLGHLSGVRVACCRHGVELGGYIAFETGLIVRFPPNAVERHFGDRQPTPDSPEFLGATAGAAHTEENRSGGKCARAESDLPSKASRLRTPLS
jgi:hypothetical protein